MNIKNYLSFSWWSSGKEAVLTALIGWIPFLPGIVIRRLMYRTIFARIGTSARIHSGVQFRRADGIKIGNRTRIHSGVRLKNSDQNTKIWIGDKAHIDRGVDIKAQNGGKIEIGENTFIGPYVCLSGESIKVGKDCLIASHSGIYAVNHNFADPTRKIKEQGVTYEGITIEDDCWLGSGVKVVDGVTIGQGSVIGAGAVVTKDIPPYSIAVGVPARVIASRKSSELVNTQNQESIYKDGSRLPMPLSTALAEVQKTAQLIHAEVEEAAELPHQDLAIKDTLPADLVLQNLLHQLFACICQVMDVGTVALLLPTEDKQELAVRATLGLEEEITQGIRIPLGRGFAGRVAASCELTIVDDLSRVEVVSPILRNKGLQSMLGVPLLVKDQVIGVLHVGRFRPRQFTRDDAQLLQLVADHIGLAIEQLAILQPSTTKDAKLVREKFALTYSRQKLSRTIADFHLHLRSIGFLELAPPPLRLVSTCC